MMLLDRVDIFGSLELRDDTGRAVRDFSVAAANADLANDPVFAEAARRIELRTSQIQANHAVVAVYSTVTVLLFVGAIGFVMAGLLPLALLLGMAVLGLLGHGILVSARRATRRAEEFRRRSFLAYGRCASCGYPIADLPDDENGLIRCPECRAAWLKSRIRFEDPSSSEGVAAETEALVPYLWPRIPKPVLEDAEGRLHRAADPRLPGAEAWLDNAAADVRSVVRWRCLWMRLGACAIFPLGVALWIHFAWKPFQRGATGTPTSLALSDFLPVFLVLLWGAGILRQIRSAWSYRSVWISRSAARCLISEGICPGCAHRLLESPDSLGASVRCGHCKGLWNARLMSESEAASRSALPS